jgi:hypothetical protein
VPQIGIADDRIGTPLTIALFEAVSERRLKMVGLVTILKSFP